jgi:hypothetical protein
LTTKNGALPLHFACSRDAALEVVFYLVHEYPGSLQVRPEQQTKTH